MVARCATPVLRLPRNERGRDFVVGDIHGCYDQVVAGMRAARFDRSTDRLLSVGDLVDRGPDPHRAERFLAEPYVFAVRGNHDDMFIEAYEDGEPHPAVVDYMTSRNGMGWWRGATRETREGYLAAVRRLPLAIEVETARGTVGLTHADVPRGMDWPTFLARLEAGDEAVTLTALWGRDRVGTGDASGVAGVGRLFVGHTPLRRPTRYGNVYAVDTGLVFGLLGGDGHLTFADMLADTLVLDGTHESAPPADFLRVVAAGHAAREGRPFSDLLGR